MLSLFERFRLRRARLKPKVAPSLQPYQDMAEAYLERLDRFRRNKRQGGNPDDRFAEDGAVIGFLVTSWVTTPVPFYSMEMALLLQRAKTKVHLIFDDEEIVREPYPPDYRMILDRVVEEARKIVTVTIAAGACGDEGGIEEARIERVSRNLAIWMEKGERAHDDYFSRDAGLRERMKKAFLRGRAALQASGVTHLVIPGGFYGLSGAYRCAAESLGMSYTTYDSSGVVLLSGLNSAAGHQKDLIEVFRDHSPIDPILMEAARTLVWREIEKRMGGTDTYGWHREAGIDSGEGYDLLVLLNVRWDAAGLDLEVAFDSVETWLSQLLDWVASRQGTTLCIREHPTGTIGISGRDDYSDLVASRPELAGRVRYVKGDEALNTYRLIERCKAVLPWSTSAGIEGAILGKPVVVHTSAYYGEMGFCRKATSAQDYFAYVEEALERPYTLKPEEIDQAAFALFLVLYCSCFPTSFNPYPEPFSEWVGLDPDELLRREDVRKVLGSMTGKKTLASCVFGQWKNEVLNASLKQ